jgi:hypothetical protein
MNERSEIEPMPDSFWTAAAWAGGVIVGLSGAAVAIHARIVRSIEHRAVDRYMGKMQASRIAELEAVRMDDHGLLLKLAGEVKSLTDSINRIEKQIDGLSKRTR